MATAIDVGKPHYGLQIWLEVFTNKVVVPSRWSAQNLQTVDISPQICIAMPPPPNALYAQFPNIKFNIIHKFDMKLPRPIIYTGIRQKMDRKDLSLLFKVLDKLDEDEEFTILMHTRAFSILELREYAEIYLKNKNMLNKIFVYPYMMPHNAYTSLLNFCDIYLSLSRGEGFDLTYRTFLWDGKPAIAINATAYPDHTVANPYLVRVKDEIKAEMRSAFVHRMAYRGGIQYLADEDDMVEKLREAIEDYRTGKNAELRKKIQEEVRQYGLEYYKQVWLEILEE